MRFIFIIIIFTCFTFCGNSNSKKNATNINDAIIDKQNNALKIKGLKQTLEKNGYTIVEQKKLGKAISKQKTIYQNSFQILKKSNNTKFHFSFFAYSDKKSCDIAVQKFISQIGDLEEITFGKELKYIKSTPVFAIFNNTTICTLKFACNTNADFALKLLKQKFTQNDSKIMTVDCGGPLNWQ